jgi:hypothetical protein
MDFMQPSPTEIQIFHHFLSASCPPLPPQCEKTASRQRVIHIADTHRQEALAALRSFLEKDLDDGCPPDHRDENLRDSSRRQQSFHVYDIDDWDISSWRRIPSWVKTKSMSRRLLVMGQVIRSRTLNDEDTDSIEAIHGADPDFRELIFIPCLCHPVKNTYRHLSPTIGTVPDSHHCIAHSRYSLSQADPNREIER